jgi:hypothetical protein
MRVNRQIIRTGRAAGGSLSAAIDYSGGALKRGHPGLASVPESHHLPANKHELDNIYALRTL